MKIYGTPASPPSRLVVGLAKYLEVEHEYITVDLRNGEQLGEAYAKLNPNKKVPTLVQGDFVLSESYAIARYLAATSTSEKAEKLYPKDAQRRALIDM